MKGERYKTMFHIHGLKKGKRLFVWKETETREMASPSTWLLLFNYIPIQIFPLKLKGFLILVKPNSCLSPSFSLCWIKWCRFGYILIYIYIFFTAFKIWAYGSHAKWSNHKSMAYCLFDSLVSLEDLASNFLLLGF